MNTFYPSLFVHTGSFNNTDVMIDNIFNLIRCPTYEASKKGFFWAIHNYWNGYASIPVIMFLAEGYDKIGFLQCISSDNFFTVNFLPKSGDFPPPKITVVILLARFAYFIKKYLPGVPKELKITIE